MSIKGNIKVVFIIMAVILIGFVSLQFTQSSPNVLKLKKGAHIILVGNNLGSRMMNFGHFETDMQLRYPDSMLYIRNMCDGGNTPGFRPHSGRPSPWAFPGAEKYQTELAKSPDSE